MDRGVRLPLRLLKASCVLTLHCTSYIERQFQFLKAIAPDVRLERPDFTRDQVRLLAYEPDISAFPDLTGSKDQATGLPRLSMDDRHAVEKIYRRGSFIGKLG